MTGWRWPNKRIKIWVKYAVEIDVPDRVPDQRRHRHGGQLLRPDCRLALVQPPAQLRAEHADRAVLYGVVGGQVVRRAALVQ